MSLMNIILLRMGGIIPYCICVDRAISAVMLRSMYSRSTDTPDIYLFLGSDRE